MFIKSNKKIYIFLAYSIVIGICYYIASNLVNDQLIIEGVKSIILAILVFIILFFVWKIIQKEDKKNLDLSIRLISKKQIFLVFFMNLCINIICFLTYFPGVGMNDGLNIMLSGMSQSQQFPIFYCAFLTVLTKTGELLGTLQYSVIMYSIIQIICVSALYTWIIVWFSKKYAPKYVKYAVLIYFLLEPLLAMYAISMLKDTLFSLCLLVVMLITYDLIFEKSEMKNKRSWALMAAILFGILSLRNNGSYIVFPLLLILLICCPRRRKGIVGMLLFSFITVMVQKMLMTYLGVEQLFQEIVAIPLQQMAAVVANHGRMTPEQVEFLNNLMPLGDMAIQYTPSSADAIKWNSMFNRDFLDDHKVEFLITWVQMLPYNFGIYVKAYLQQTFWFWAPLQEGTVQCLYTIENVSNNAWLTDFLMTTGIHDQSLLPETLNNILRTWYGLGNKFLREGVCFWIMLGSLLLSILKNKTWKMILVYAPVLLLWLTIMISTPVAESMRYVFVFAYALPFFVGILFIKNKNSEGMIGK